MKMLKDYFPDGITGDGIFKAIFDITNFPLVDPANIDTYFILAHGEKLASSACEYFTDDDGHITGDRLKNLARVIHNKFINNWEHEYKTLTVEYNPIENTDYVETVKDKSTASGNSSGTGTNSQTTTGGVWGFNGGEVNDSKTISGGTTGNTGNFSNTGSNDREIRKHGNIGVTTNADMIASDLDVWKLNNFYDILCRDVCSVIALSIF